MEWASNVGHDMKTRSVRGYFRAKGSAPGVWELDCKVQGRWIKICWLRF